MLELGIKGTVYGDETLIKLSLHGKPEVFPEIQENHKIICGYDQGLGEKLFVCEDLSEMQKLYDAYSLGGALSISWYHAENPSVVMVVPCK